MDVGVADIPGVPQAQAQGFSFSGGLPHPPDFSRAVQAGKLAIREGTNFGEAWGHDWGRERGRVVRGRQKGLAAHSCLAGALLHARGEQRAELWVVRALGRVTGGWGPSQKAHHLSTCCSSRSTASARLST